MKSLTGGRDLRHQDHLAAMLIDMTLGMRGSYYSESLGRQIRSSFRPQPYLAEITERNFGFDESKAQLSMQGWHC